jgi:hypothetical protein
MSFMGPQDAGSRDDTAQRHELLWTTGALASALPVLRGAFFVFAGAKAPLLPRLFFSGLKAAAPSGWAVRRCGRRAVAVHGF